jgi:hypothetical protein
MAFGHYLTESVDKVVLKMSIPAQIRQLACYYYQYKEHVDGFKRESTFAEQLYKHCM